MESTPSARRDLIALSNGRNADRFLLDNGCDMRVRVFRSIPPSFQSQACAVSRRPAHFTCDLNSSVMKFPRIFEWKIFKATRDGTKAHVSLGGTQTITCPSCGSRRIHQSRRKGLLEKCILAAIFARPFRCERCDERFFALSLKKVPNGSRIKEVL